MGGPVVLPLIGLSTYREQARWGAWDQPADLLPTVYADAVRLAGGVPVLLPPRQARAAEAAAVVRRLDGLVVTGGADVEPVRYGADPHPRTTRVRPDRDAWELALLDAAQEAGLPVLGICRGMQVMAVHAGGTLAQHVPDAVGHDEHSPGADQYGDIEVRTLPGTRLADLLPERGTVSCHHHQSVSTHPGYVPAASADDGTLEAMESPGRPVRPGGPVAPGGPRGRRAVRRAGRRSLGPQAVAGPQIPYRVGNGCGRSSVPGARSGSLPCMWVVALSTGGC